MQDSPEDNDPSNAPAKERVKWPPMNNHQAWKEFEEDVVQTLELALCGSVDRKVQVLANVIHAMGKKQVRDARKERKKHSCHQEEQTRKKDC